MGKNWVGLVILGLVVWLILRQRQPQTSTNEEIMTWTDYRGHEYRIEVHRDVHRS